MKKQLLMAILMGWCINLYAQNNGNGQGNQHNNGHKTVVQKMDSLLENIPKANITSGILYDRVIPYAKLDKFNQQNDTSHFRHFRQAWSELHRASYNPNFKSVDELQEALSRNLDYDVVDIGLIHSRFHRLDSAGIRMANGRPQAVPGRNPFVAQSVMVVAPLKEKAWGHKIRFRFQEDFWMQHSDNPILSLRANMGNDVWHTIMENGKIVMNELEVAYQNEGLQLLRFKATLADGSEQYTQSSMLLKFPVLLNDELIDNGIIKANIAFKGYNESTAIKGVNQYRIYYRTQNNNTLKTLQKPIIILDGFDPLDDRKIHPDDDGYIEEASSIYELMNYEEGNVEKNLVQVLRDEGYDVVIVNHHAYTAVETGQTIVGGGDYMERNAMVLVALIQKLDSQLVVNSSQEQLVVVGPSMGGLISRYALAYMEKNNMPHKTRLWVSFDAPHLGANIPIGAQEALHFFGIEGGQEDAADSYNKKLYSVAARQLLLVQRTGASLRTPFLNNLHSNGVSESNGFPMNLRKVALINGTTLGTKNGTEGQRSLDGHAKVLGIKVAEIKTSFMATPGGQSVNIFYGMMAFPSVFTVSSSLSLTYGNSNMNGSMDVVQGAHYNTGEVMYEQFSKAFNKNPLNGTWNTHINNHTFIPTVSSLALKNATYNWNTPLRRNLVCTEETPFDSYYAPTVNQRHIYPTADNVAWIMEELNGQPQPPTVRLLAADLGGPDMLCNNQQTTYTFGNCKTPGSATWSASAGLQIVNSASGSITVKAAAGGSGYRTITANFGNGVSVSKQIWTGVPQAVLSPMTQVGSINGNCIPKNTIYDISCEVMSVPGATDVRWRTFPSHSGIGITWNYNGSGIHAVINANHTVPAGCYDLYVEPLNECGVSLGTAFTQIEITDFTSCNNCMGGIGPMFMVFPNPTDDELRVEVVNEDELTTVQIQDLEYQLIINNEHGKVIYDHSLRSPKAKVNIRNFKKGYYHVKVIYHGEQYSYKILKN